MAIRIKKGSSATWEMFGLISPKLGIYFYSLVNQFKYLGINDLTITSIIRQKFDDSGIHATGRAIDISVQGMDITAVQLAVEYINNKFTYDPARPRMDVAILHTGSGYKGDTAEHIHLQSAT